MKNTKYKKLILLTFLFIFILSLNKIYSQSTPQLLPGFPKEIEPLLRPTCSYTTPLTADFNSDGFKEILISTGPSGQNFVRLYLVKHNGNIVNNWPIDFIDAYTSATAAGDVNGDGFIDIVHKTNDSLYVFNYDGSLHNGFPVSTANPQESYVAVSLYDFDNDGKLEIVTNKYKELFVFNYDGTIRNGWPKIIDLAYRTYLGPISIGDLNNDNTAEIIIPSTGSNYPTDSVQLNVFSIDGTIPSGWPIVIDSNYFFGSYVSAGIFKDIGQDSSYLVINSNYKTIFNDFKIRVSTYNYNGILIMRYIFPSYKRTNGMSLGDFNGDGVIEHAFANEYDSAYIFTREGYLIGKSYRCVARYNKTLAIGRLSNEMNIISTDNRAISDSGFIYGYYPDGNPLEWSPLRFFGMGYGSVTFSDINNDGQADMILAVGGLGGCPQVRTFVYVWTFPGVTFSYDNFPWPMYGHDRYRTFQHGFIPPDEPIGINTISNNIPDKFYLHQNYPNPFNPSTSIRFDVPSSSFVIITVYNILGKEITTLINEKLSAGSYELNWDGSSFPSGVYFYRIVVHSDKLKTGEFSDNKRMVLVK